MDKLARIRTKKELERLGWKFRGISYYKDNAENSITSEMLLRKNQIVKVIKKRNYGYKIENDKEDWGWPEESLDFNLSKLAKLLYE
jgi:hypothetical protein